MAQLKTLLENLTCLSLLVVLCNIKFLDSQTLHLRFLLLPCPPLNATKLCLLHPHRLINLLPKSKLLIPKHCRSRGCFFFSHPLYLKLCKHTLHVENFMQYELHYNFDLKKNQTCP